MITKGGIQTDTFQSSHESTEPVDMKENQGKNEYNNTHSKKFSQSAKSNIPVGGSG